MKKAKIYIPTKTAMQSGLGKNNKWLFIIFFACLILGILTFFTFINESFIEFSLFNLQTLLIIDLILVALFFAIILNEIFKLIKKARAKKVGT